MQAALVADRSGRVIRTHSEHTVTFLSDQPWRTSRR